MSPDNNHHPVGSADDEKAGSTTGPETSSEVLPTVPLKCPRCDSPDIIIGQTKIYCKTCLSWAISNHSYIGESSTSSGPEVSDAFPSLYPNSNPGEVIKLNFGQFEIFKLRQEISDTVKMMNIKKITPELESLLQIHTTQFIKKYHAELSGFRYDSSFDGFSLEKFIVKQFFKTAGVVDGIKRYDGVTEKEFSKLFSRYETSLLNDCVIRSQMRDASSPMSLKREFTLEGKYNAEFFFFFERNAEFDHEVDGESSQYQKRAVSTEYSFIHTSIDQFIEKNINTIGDDQVKLDQYGMPRLRAFITLKFFQMAEESGLMRVMDSTNISAMLRYFEEPLLRDCIQEIHEGPIRNKTFAQPESEEEKLDQRIRKIKFLQDINLDSAIQGAAVVVGHVFSSSKSQVVLIGMMSALLMGISCSSLAHLLRNKYESVSKVLTKVGLMGTASTVIIAIAALFPEVIMSCIFGTIAILLLAFTVILN